MSYSGYNTSIVERYRVKLIGWTYKDFVNPSKIGTITDVRNLRDALRSGQCHWTRLSQNEVETYLQENGDETRKTRRQRSDKGKSRKNRIESDDEDDEDIENQPPAKKAKHGRTEGRL